jgi:hypothetical protein
MATARAASRGGTGAGAALAALPLLVLPVGAYNLLVLFGLIDGWNARAADGRLGAPLLRFPMASGSEWPVSAGDLLILFALVVLFVELLKSTTSRRTVIVNHALSMVLFIVCLVQFLLLPAFATSTFFLIMLMVLLDVLAGFIVTIVSARRDFDLTA